MALFINIAVDLNLLTESMIRMTDYAYRICLITENGNFFSKFIPKIHIENGLWKVQMIIFKRQIGQSQP